mgnify:FL=1
MTIEFKNSNFFSKAKDIFIRDDKNTLKIFYGANGDLYLDIFGSRKVDENLLYTATLLVSEEEEVYKYFETLIDDIINCNVLDTSEIELQTCDNEIEKEKLLNSVQSQNAAIKNSDTYKSLVQTSTITWYSDNIYDERANILRITKSANNITLNFTDNPDDPAFGFSIRICNSGSKYDPFNICFMKLFNELQILSNKTNQMKLVRK